MTVPYTFANQIGPIPLQELDQNFAAVSAGVSTAVTVTGNAQPNITSVGVLNSLSLDATAIAIGANTTANSAVYTISIGGNAGAINQGNNAISIGGLAGNNEQGSNGVSVGFFAGFDSQGPDCVAIGTFAGQYNQNFGAVAVGRGAGNSSQFSNAVAIGRNAGFLNQSTQAVAVGQRAGNTNQGSQAVAIGAQAALNNQGANSVAIGAYAGNPSMGPNSICINGLPGNLNAPIANSLYIAPIRNSNANVTNALYYNILTKEVTYAPAGVSISNGNSNVTISTSDGNVTIAVAGNTISTFTTDGLSTVGNVDATDMNVANTVTATTFIGNFQGNITGNLVVPGANTWVLFNNNGNADSSSNFRYDAATTALVAGNSVTSSYFIGDGSLLTNVSSNLSNITSNISTTGNIYANYFIGNGSLLTNLPTGNYSNANVAAYLPTFNGNLTANNALFAGNITADYYFGDGSLLTNLPAGNYSNSNVASYLVTYGGNVKVSNITNTGGNAVGNIGNSTAYFNRAFVQSTTALYADLAEMYAADQNYIPGTVLEIGGSQEVQATSQLESSAIAGVVSTNPSYTMNSGISAQFPVTVALLGRVPTRVIGTIKKGQILVSSNLPGVAMAGVNIPQGSIVGKALQDYDSQEEGIIEVLVGRI